MKTLTFNINKKRREGILDSLNAFLCSNGYTVQEFKKENGVILQAKKGGGFKKLLGLATATNITIDQFEDLFTVSLSQGRWIDKAAVAGVSMFVLWPLLITSAVGAYKQAELPNKIIDFLNSEINRRLSMKTKDK